MTIRALRAQLRRVDLLPCRHQSQVHVFPGKYSLEPPAATGRPLQQVPARLNVKLPDLDKVRGRS